jgi:YD repeat-containing protein
VVEQRESEDRFAKYRYDGNGNLTEAANQNVRVQRSYDADGNLIEKGYGGYKVESEYDLNGHRVRRSSVLRHEVEYVYDESGDLAAVAVDERPVIRIRRDARQLPQTEVLGWNLQRDFFWDADGYLVRQQVRRAETILGSRGFHHDKNGNLRERWDRRWGSTALSYDPLGRLASYVAPATRHLGAVPRLEPGPASPSGAMRWQSQDATYEFDAAGNLATRRNAQGEITFEWDAFGQLTAARTANGDEVHYSYDALGRRIRKQIHGYKSFLWRSFPSLWVSNEIQCYLYWP